MTQFKSKYVKFFKFKDQKGMYTIPEKVKVYCFYPWPVLLLRDNLKTILSSIFV